MYKLLLLVLILFLIVILETYYIFKNYLYICEKHVGDDLEYNFLIHSQDEIKTYMISQSFYVTTMNNAAFIVLKLKRNTENKGLTLISNALTSNNTCSFMNNGYKYLIDSDGFWIDFSYNRCNDKIINCVQWINNSVNVSDNSPIALTYCYDKNNDTLIIVLKDSANDKYVNIIHNQKYDDIIITKDNIYSNAKCVLYSVI